MPTPPPTLETDNARATLPRAIGLLASTSLVVGTIIGSGIFLVPHNVALHVGSIKSLALVWIVGGILSLAGALSLAELGAASPEAGGIYIYLRNAYGKLACFLYGWATLAVIETGGIATLGVAFGIYSTAFFHFTPLAQRIIACGVIALLTAVNVAGVKKGAAVQVVFTFAKLLGLGIIVVFAVFSSGIQPMPGTHSLPTPTTSFGSFGIALVGVLWAFHGWHHLSYAAGEVKDPARVLPRSFLWGTSVVLLGYLAANFAYLRVLSLEALAEHERVAHKAMEILVGPFGAKLVSAMILCSIFGALNGNILGGARVLFAMARDGMFFSAVGRVDKKFQTPATALSLQGIWAMALAASGSFEQLYTYVIFAAWIFYCGAIMAVIILRRREPHLNRPYLVWGYPVVPIAFSVTALLIVINTLVRSPRESFIGLGLVLLGIPIYFAWSWLARGTDIAG
ncbi:MAG: amino acid permease [Acidobacteria bacterium]|nr:amino acid permease [Acidobacteriota bacterium]